MESPETFTKKRKEKNMIKEEGREKGLAGCCRMFGAPDVFVSRIKVGSHSDLDVTLQPATPCLALIS